MKARATFLHTLFQKGRAELIICCYVALIWHAFWISFSLDKNSYDRPAHIFFAHHYAQDWFALWSDSWFGGFYVSSYPPLVHQLIACLSFLYDLEPAYLCVMITTLALFPVGIYYFLRIFISREEALRAAFFSIFLLSLNIHAHVFGQLPFLVSSLALLFLLAQLDRYLRKPDWLSLGRCLLLAAVVSASHGFSGATIGVPGALLVILHRLVKRTSNISFGQVFVLGGFCFLAAYLVIYPHFLWRAENFVLQTPIPHSSRADMLIDEAGRWAFFWTEYGPLALFLPLVPLIFIMNRSLWPLFAFWLFNFLLGLGASTAFPELLFGKAWEWLTYDRYSFWASILILPFIARAFRPAALAGGREKIKLYVTSSLAVLLFAVGGWQIYNYFKVGSPFRFPPPIDLHPIAFFLKSDRNDAWRYLTLGLGDQAVRLSYLTDAKTIDGPYYTARTIPELTSSGIGMLDWAVRTRRPDVLNEFLNDPARFNLRWMFTRDEPRYETTLLKAGWRHTETLGNGIELWEPPIVIPPIPRIPEVAITYQALAWGIAPMACFFALMALTAPALVRRFIE